MCSTARLLEYAKYEKHSTPRLTPREGGHDHQCWHRDRHLSGSRRGLCELVTFPVMCSALPSTGRGKSAVVAANTGISTREMKSSARAGSWTWPWAMDAGARDRPARSATRWQRAGGFQQAPARRTSRRAYHGPRARHGASPDRHQSHRCAVPVGRGQRELILGDRQTGKTAIAIDTILNQRDHQCCACIVPSGSARPPVAKAVATLREKGAMEYTVLVVTEGNDPPGLAYIAPYAADQHRRGFHGSGPRCADRLRRPHHHARAYRELSLLLRRPPGREAFPGDIFYIHSRLLERGDALAHELGGGSLTALPIIENRSTGHLRLYSDQLDFHHRWTDLTSRRRCSNWVCCLRSMSENPFRALAGKRSVRPTARGGRRPQARLRHSLRNSKPFPVRARLDEDTRKIIEHGRRIRACLKTAGIRAGVRAAQIAVLLALTAELFDVVPLDQMTDAEHVLREAAAEIPAEVRKRLDTADTLSDEDRETIIQIARKSLSSLPAKA